MSAPERAAAAWFEQARAWSDREITRALEAHDLGPPSLEEALRYALQGGGKRVRPALVKLCAEASSGSDARSSKDAALAAVAVECIHTYSLVHDDLPSMDDDDLRRGRATVHRAFDEATAVLVGDALQTLAFEVLAEAGRDAAQMVRILARAAGPAGMVGGQVLDLASEGVDLDEQDVAGIHASKTAALLGAATELGAVTAGRPTESARRFGQAIGMCFQALDDILDVIGDAATLGKTPGKDAEAAKGTLVAAIGLERTRAVARAHAETARAEAIHLGLGELGVGVVDLLLERKS